MNFDDMAFAQMLKGYSVFHGLACNSEVVCFDAVV